jgi:hypothetical protein
MLHWVFQQLLYMKFQGVNMAHLHEAIRALNPSIVNIADLKATDDRGNVIDYDMAEAEAKLVELQAAEAQVEQADKDAKASAVAKLAALGLTEAEVKALLGV